MKARCLTRLWLWLWIVVKILFLLVLHLKLYFKELDLFSKLKNCQFRCRLRNWITTAICETRWIIMINLWKFVKEYRRCCTCLRFKKYNQVWIYIYLVNIVCIHVKHQQFSMSNKMVSKAVSKKYYSSCFFLISEYFLTKIWLDLRYLGSFIFCSH